MFTFRKNATGILVLLLAVWLSISVIVRARTLDDSVGADTIISNRAEATYRNDTGESFTTVSATVTVTVLPVATIVVTPDETASSGTVTPREQVTRAFRVCNSGNTADSFTVTRAEVTAPATINSLYFDIDDSGTITPEDGLIRLNESASPVRSPGSCVGVLAVIDTNDTAPQSTITISLASRSTSVNAVNGRGEDTGTIINAVGQGARLTDPSNANLPPVKMVNGASQTVVSAGGQFAYSISFRNSGDIVARNVVIGDQLPREIEYLPGSLALNDRILSDALDADEGSVRNGLVEIRLSQVNPGEVFRINLKARLAGSVAAGTGLVNTASLSADNLAPIKSSSATVIVDP